MEKNQTIFAVTFDSGKCVFLEGMRHIPSDEVLEEVVAAKKWLPQPILPFGENYQFYLTAHGREHYEKKLKKVHETFLSGIDYDSLAIDAVGEIVYHDEFQVIANPHMAQNEELTKIKI